MVVITIYLSAIRVELPLMRAGYRGEKIAPYEIKLMYAGNYPIILYHSLLNNLYMVARILERRPSYKLIHILVGKFGPDDSGRLRPASGAVFWLTSPSRFSSLFQNPLLELTRLVIVIIIIATFSYTWTEVNGTGAGNVAKSLKKNKLLIKGYRANSLYKVLNRYIPVCAYVGGASLGAITIIATLLGSVSSGSGTLMAVGIVIKMWEKITKATGMGAGDLISHNVDDIFTGRWNW
jgi:preprotein translocase subunit SecY